MARGVFLDQGSDLCLLHWQAASLLLSLWGSPILGISEQTITTGLWKLERSSRLAGNTKTGGTATWWIPRAFVLSPIYSWPQVTEESCNLEPPTAIDRRTKKSLPSVAKQSGEGTPNRDPVWNHNACFTSWARRQSDLLATVSAARPPAVLVSHSHKRTSL